MKYKIRHALGWVFIAFCTLACFMPFKGLEHFLEQIATLLLSVLLSALIIWMITSKEDDE